MTAPDIAAPDRPNPLLGAWTGPFETPPFAAIRPEHFRPAFDRAMEENMAEIEEIAGNTEAASFDNTIAALERSGRALTQVSAVFHALAGAHTNDAILALEREMSPRLAAHRNRIQLHGGLYARIRALWDRRGELGLTGEQARVLERYEVTFRRAGAGLPAAAKQRVAEIGERLATLGTAFSQNVLADEQSYALMLETEDDLAGLGTAARDAARAAAQERSLAGKYAITLARSSIEPFLASSTRRDLREKAFQTILRNRVQRGGIMAAGAGLVKTGEKGRGLSSRWYPDTLARRIREINRLKDRLTFIQGDGFSLIEEHKGDQDAVFYIDPPYTLAARRLYTQWKIDHARLFSLMSACKGDFLMSYDNTGEIADLSKKYGFETRPIAMKNTHHAKMTELLIGKDLSWLQSSP